VGFADRCVSMQQSSPGPTLPNMRPDAVPNTIDVDAMTDLEIFVAMTDNDLWDDVRSTARVSSYIVFCSNPNAVIIHNCCNAWNTVVHPNAHPVGLSVLG